MTSTWNDSSSDSLPEASSLVSSAPAQISSTGDTNTSTVSGVAGQESVPRAKELESQDLDEHMIGIARRFVTSRLPPRIEDVEVGRAFARMRGCIDPVNCTETFRPRGEPGPGEAYDAQGFTPSQRAAPQLCWNQYDERTVLCWGYWNAHEFQRETEALVALFESTQRPVQSKRDFRSFWKQRLAMIKEHRRATAQLRIAQDETDGLLDEGAVPGLNRYIVNANRLGTFVADMDTLLGSHMESARIYANDRRIVTPTLSIKGDERRLELLPMSANRACAMFSRVAQFTRANSKGELEPCDPPKRYGELWLDRDERPPFRQLHQVVYGPTLLRDGTLLKKPGYHAEAEMFMIDDNADWPDIPDEPTKEDAERALRLLEIEFYDSFPFSDPGDQLVGTSKSVALSALLSAVARPMLPILPLHMFTAAQNRAGKSLLVVAPARIAFGVDYSNAAHLRTRDGAAEELKTVKSFLRSKRPVINFDNISGSFENDTLAGWLTAPVIDLRDFGTLNDEVVRNSPLWAATGVNISPAGDFVPRTVVCTLDIGTRRATERVEGRRENVEQWLLSNRPRLYSAAVTILRAWNVARARGEPVRAGHIDAFGLWREIVAGALVWLGRADPLGSISLAYEEDVRAEEREMTFAAIRAIAGSVPFTAADLVRLVGDAPESFIGSRTPLGRAAHQLSNRPEFRDRMEQLRLVLRTVARDRAVGDIDARHLGRALNGWGGAEASGLKLVRAKRHTKRGALWRLVGPGDQADLDLGDDEEATQSPVRVVGGIGQGELSTELVG